MSGWIAGAEVSHLAPARSATSRKLSARVVPSSLSGTWPVPPRDRARFRGAVAGYTFIPSLVTAQPERGGQPGHSPALPGKHRDTAATKPRGSGMGEHPAALGLQQREERQNSIVTEVLEGQLDFFSEVTNNSSPCNFCIHLVLEQMAFQRMLFQNWDYPWA